MLARTGRPVAVSIRRPVTTTPLGSSSVVSIGLSPSVSVTVILAPRKGCDGPGSFVGGDLIDLALGQADETEAALRVGPGRDRRPGRRFDAQDPDTRHGLARRLRPDDADDRFARTDDVLEGRADERRLGAMADEHHASRSAAPAAGEASAASWAGRAIA